MLIDHVRRAEGSGLALRQKNYLTAQQGFLITSLVSSVQQKNLTLDVLEYLGIFSKYHGFVFIPDIFPDHFLHLMQRVFHRDFVPKIRRKHAPGGPI